MTTLVSATVFLRLPYHNVPPTVVGHMRSTVRVVDLWSRLLRPVRKEDV